MGRFEVNMYTWIFHFLRGVGGGGLTALSSDLWREKIHKQLTWSTFLFIGRHAILRNLIIYTYIGLHSYFSDVKYTMTWKKNHLYRYSAIIERKLQTHQPIARLACITTAMTSSIMGEGGWGWGVGTLAERIMFHSCPCKRKKKMVNFWI